MAQKNKQENHIKILATPIISFIKTLIFYRWSTQSETISLIETVHQIKRTHCSKSVTVWMIRPFLQDIDKKSNFFSRYLGLHASEADSGLCPECDGLLVSGVEDVDELGVISAGRAVVESCRSTHHVTV